MAVPFHPPPPDEQSLRRLQELVEELYALIVCHLINNPANPPGETPKRTGRGPSCTDDVHQDVKRDGGDSDSDPDACSAPTASNADAVFAEVAAELDLVQNQRRRHPGDLVAPLKPLPDSSTDHPQPTGSGSSPSTCKCFFPGKPEALPGQWRKVGHDLRLVADSYGGDQTNAPTHQTQGSSGFLNSVLGYQPFGVPMWMTTIACVIGYRLFCANT